MYVVAQLSILNHRPYTIAFADHIYTTFRFGEEDQDDFLKPGKPVPRLQNSGPTSLVLAVLMGSVFLGFPFRYLRYFSELDTCFLRAEQWRLHLQRLLKEWNDSNLLVRIGLHCCPCETLTSSRLTGHSSPRVSSDNNLFFPNPLNFSCNSVQLWHSLPSLNSNPSPAPPYSYLP